MTRTPPNTSATVDEQVAAGIARDAARTLADAFPGVTPVDKSTIAVPVDKSTVASSPLPVPAGMSFAELAAGADTIPGYDLEQDKAALLSVPHLIMSFTFRDGIMRNKMSTNYVSIEAIIADGPTLAQRVKSGRLAADAASRIIPNDAIVYNDGSTGICRQVVAYLHNVGMITVPDGPDGGEAGESRFDTYRAAWKLRTPDGGWRPATADDSFRFDVRLLVQRGLRLSEYDANGIEGSTTYYLA